MRCCTLVLASLALTLSPRGSHAQSDNRSSARAIFDGPATIGYFFALDANVGRVNGSAGVLSGAEIVVLLNHRFSIGLSGAGLVNDEDAEDVTPNARARLRFGYGGITLGYVTAPASTLHLVVDALVAGGNVRPENDNSTGEREDGDEIFVFQPSIVAEANLARHLRAAAGLSYRAVSGVALTGISNAAMSGLSLRLVIRAGSF